MESLNAIYYIYLKCIIVCIYSKDIQNDTIKTMFASNQEESKQVKQAWTSSTEAPMTSFEAVRRRKKSQDRNLNLINNNGDSIDLKRRSYHPQDYLSQVLEPKPVKRKDFPKVNTYAQKLKWLQYIRTRPILQQYTSISSTKEDPLGTSSL